MHTYMHTNKQTHTHTHTCTNTQITDDLKVVASTHEQRQKIRAHELLERKETLLHKLETQEQMRINRLQQQALQVPLGYKERMLKAEERREKADRIQQMKMEKIIQAEQVSSYLITQPYIFTTMT